MWQTAESLVPLHIPEVYMKRIFTSALSLTAVLCLFGGGVHAATFHAEKLGPMPAANIDMETDLKYGPIK
jgi:hypothetical protein